MDAERGHRPRRAGCLVCVLALAARLAAIPILGFGDPSRSADARAYHQLAVNLVQRHDYVTDADPPHRLDVPYATRPPLTPWLLAAAYLVSGPSWRAGQLVMVVVGAAGCGPTFVLGCELFGLQIGLVAGLTAALYPFFVFLSAFPLTENLGIVLYVWLTILLLKVRERHRLRDALAAGIVLGVAALNKPTVLGAAPLFLGWILLTSEGGVKQAVPLALLLLAATLATLAPWTVRNYLRLGAVFPVTTQTGAALYMANGFHAEYPISLLENGATGWYDRPGSGLPVDGLSPFEADRKHARTALRFIRDHPGKFVEQAFRRVRIFWRVYPHPADELSWGIVEVLSAIGVFMTRRAWRRLIPVYLLILQTATIPILFPSVPRYRAPIEPFLIILAAVPPVMFWRRWRQGGIHAINVKVA